MPHDPFARRVYLQPFPDPLIPAQYSRGSRRRAGQLQAFVKTLHSAAQPFLEPTGNCQLLIVSARDWRKLFSYPYGLPFTRQQKGEGRVSIIAAADYPERMLHRFDDVLVRAAQAGEAQPGDLREFLDLLIGHEWGHAAANLSGLRTRVKWFDEWMATYLFLATLREAGLEHILTRFVAWARLEVAGSAAGRADLGSFEYPRVRLKFDNLLWFQGVFTLRAAEVLALRGWDFPLAMRAALSSADRGDVARTLVELEPSFKPWFAVFAGETA